jgi:hypothetical protein
VPPDLLDEAVDVLLELPREPGLADPGDADDRGEVRTPLLRARLSGQFFYIRCLRGHFKVTKFKVLHSMK